MVFMVGSGRNSNSSECLRLDLLSAIFIKLESKVKDLRYSQAFSQSKSMGTFGFSYQASLRIRMK